MNSSGLREIVLAALGALAAVTMLPACSSTEEAPPPEETSSGTGPCDCLVGDIECREKCIRDPPI